MTLRDSVIIVTGSATGLGAAIVKQVAAKGARVVVNYTKSEKEAHETVAVCDYLGVESILCKLRGPRRFEPAEGRACNILERTGFLRCHLTTGPWGNRPSLASEPARGEACCETVLLMVSTADATTNPQAQTKKTPRIVDQDRGAK